MTALQRDAGPWRGALSTARPMVGALGANLMAPLLPERFVQRPRVVACFGSTAGARLTVVTGPAGVGKTTAVGEWLLHENASVAWVTVESSDNELRTFCRDVLAGIQLSMAPSDSAFQADAASQIAAGGLAHALRELRWPDRPTVLVLDDFHVVKSSAIVSELQTVLERKPRWLHVVVVSRSDPSLPLARWRLRGELHEIREAELRFRPDEAAAYFRTFTDLELEERATNTLTARTEGWIAGLQLAAISLRESADRSAFIARFDGTDRFIADFLLDEVLGQLPDDILDFLLETSVLDRFDAELCNTMTGRSDAALQLRRIEAANLFLVRLTANGTLFRYHTLFRDLLRFELESQRPDRARELCRRAAQHVAARGDIAAAVRLLAAAGDDDAAFSFALRLGTELSPGARAAARACAGTLSSSFIADDVGRMLTFADVLRKAGRLEDSAVWLERASGASSRRPDDRAVRAPLEAVWSKWYQAHGDCDAAIEHANRALRLARPEHLTGDPGFEGLSLFLARAWLLHRDPERSRRALEAVPRTSVDPLTTEVAVPALLSRIAAHEGRLREASVFAERALWMAESLGDERHPATMDALLARGRVRRERDELVDAALDVDAELALAADLDSHPYIVLGEIERCRITAALDGPAAALERVDAIRASKRQRLARCLAEAVCVLEIELSVRAGNYEHAARLTSTLPAGLEREMLAAAWEIAGGRIQGARDRLAALVPIHLLDRIRVELLRAVVAVDVDDRRRHVATAAALGAPEGFRRIFTDKGKAVSRAVCSLAASAEVEPPALELLTAVAELPQVQVDTPMVDPLTEREQSILRFFPTQLSYHDIASELLISVNTLKTHVKSIHRKLGVSSRAAAIDEARQLGLLRRADATA